MASKGENFVAINVHQRLEYPKGIILSLYSLFEGSQQGVFWLVRKKKVTHLPSSGGGGASLFLIRPNFSILEDSSNKEYSENALRSSTGLKYFDTQ